MLNPKRGGRRTRMNWRWSPATGRESREMFVKHEGEEGQGGVITGSSVASNSSTECMEIQQHYCVQIDAADLLQIVPCCFDNPYCICRDAQQQQQDSGNRLHGSRIGHGSKVGLVPSRSSRWVEGLRGLGGWSVPSPFAARIKNWGRALWPLIHAEIVLANELK